MYPWDLIDEILILYQESLWRKSSDPIFFYVLITYFGMEIRKKKIDFKNQTWSYLRYILIQIT